MKDRVAPLIVIVSLRLRADRIGQFRFAIAKQASSTMRLEPGCLRFEVLAVNDDPNRYMLYEVYTGPEAWAAHRTTAHFKEWRAAIDGCLEPNGQTNIYCSPLDPKSDRATP